MSRADIFASNDKKIQDHVLEGEATDAEILAGDSESKRWVSVRRLVKALSSFALRESPSLTGKPKAPTPPQFNNTTEISTTEFVQRAQGNYREAYMYDTAQTLTVDHCGCDIELYGGVPTTTTLPLLSAVGKQSAIRFINLGSVSMTIVCQGADVFLSMSALTSIVLLPGDTVELHSFNGWVVMGGSIALKYAAVMYGPNWTTRPQFDNTKSFATTEFVQRAVGSLPGEPVVLVANTVLTASQAGTLFIVGAAWQTTLPPLSSTPNGTAFHFLFTSSGGSIKGSGTEGIQGISGGNLYLPVVGEKVTLVKRSNAWYLGGGGLGAEAFNASLSLNGYQKLPSGCIEQWGTIALPASASTAPLVITFPIAFPTAAFQVVAGIGVVIADYDVSPTYRLDRQEVSMGIPTLAGCECQVFVDNNYHDNRAIYWRALGK